MRRASALSLSTALTLAAATTKAQYSDIAGKLSPTDDSSGAPAPPPPPSLSGPTATRFAVVGAYRSVFDLGLAGGGGSIAYGGDGPFSGGFELRFVTGRSLGGLGFSETTAMGTIMGAAGGLRVGGGLGLDLLTITRATTGDLMGALGIGAMARVGYDFGRHQGLFVNTDYDVQLSATLTYGPNVSIGYKF